MFSSLSPLHVSSSSPRNLTQPPDIIIHSPHNERKEISKEHLAVKSVRRKRTNSRTRRRKRSSRCFYYVTLDRIYGENSICLDNKSISKRETGCTPNSTLENYLRH